jgi:catechol 2,3-dioxygenase-like lactoylglutathione lyase family enzyme
MPAMPFHHVAIATRDLDATHRFYTEAMGFTLVKAEAAPTLEQTGWARHLFYDTGNGQLFAVWDLHDETLPDFDPAISTGLGLPAWVNHIAFAAATSAALDEARARLLEHGYDVIEVDHGWCHSIYANDPSGTLVEFCCTTRALTAADATEAAAMLAADMPALGDAPAFEIHEAASG